MKRLLLVIGVCIAIACCAGSPTPARPESSPSNSSRPSPSDPRSALSATPAPEKASNAVGPGGVVAYELGGRLWVVDADGTHARELLPNDAGYQSPLAWSWDGSRLLYASDTTLALTDAAGSGSETLEFPCPTNPGTDPLTYTCQATRDKVAMSPDGTRLAYTIWEGSLDQANQDATNSIVILDRTTGRVTKLESTETPTHPEGECDASARQGENVWPSWSPDGNRLVFGRGPTANGICQMATLTVNVDGSDLRQVPGPGQPQGRQHPSWLADGSIVFNSDGQTWTRDGRVATLRFAGNTAKSDLWIMDADGANASPVEATVPALTAIGCLVCPYPVQNGANGPEIDPLAAAQPHPYQPAAMTNLLWQPVPAGQP